MYKLISATLIAGTLVVGTAFVGTLENSQRVFAGTCASKCGPRPIQFTPGQRVRLIVVNQTPNSIQLEKTHGNKPISLQPGQKLQIENGDGTQPNISLVFWEQTGLALKANITKPNFATLQVELRPEWRHKGDSAVYLDDDGRVKLL